MAKPTERALKRKPMAVILLTTLRKDVPNVPDGQGGREFEWFETAKGMHDYFAQNVTYHKEDAKDHDDMAYMAIEIRDTAKMTLGKVDVQPVTDETIEWMESVKNDITLAFQPEAKKTSTETDGSKKVVRPRRKSAAAQAVVKDDTKAKTTRLKERLAAKKSEKTEDAKPTPAKKTAAKKATPPAKKTAAKKASPAEESKQDFVVVKASTAPDPVVDAPEVPTTT